MAVRVKGLTEFRAGLRKAGKELPKAVGKANREISDKVVDKAKPAVHGLRSPAGHLAVKGIRPSSKQKAAVIRLNNRSRQPIFASVFGANSHMVFGRKVRGSGPWQPWIGNQWTPEQLYGLGPVIKDAADGFVLDDYLDAILEALHPAFPE